MSEKIKISLINKSTSEKKMKKVAPSMKLNEFREAQKIGSNYVFISDDGNVDVEDEKDFEIQEILKKENDTNCIYIKIDKKKEEEFERLEEEVKKAISDENKLQKNINYRLKCNKCGYTDYSSHSGWINYGPFGEYDNQGQNLGNYQRYAWDFDDKLIGDFRYPGGPWPTREVLIENGCICGCPSSKGIKWWSFVNEDERTIKY